MSRTNISIILFLIALLKLVICVPIESKVRESQCGYESCNPSKDGYINIHLVPHSHDDVGWLKTVDQYYYGARNEIYKAGVQFIYDTVLDSLLRKKNRRFIAVETAFFWKWWTEQEEDVREDVRNLVNTGQLEFISGGWSMNDEGVTNYQSIIDQMTWGLRILNDTFGECGVPKTGWQIDPFGHSNEMASIFARLGFDGVFLGRIDFQDKFQRLEDKSMEMVWRGSESLGGVSDIYTGVLYDHYGSPPGLCFDVLCEDDAIIDDLDSPNYNVEQKAITFLIDYVNMAVPSYATTNLLVPMGNDFNYQNAEMWYKNMDRLMKYINSRTFNDTKYNVIYSTPSCYINTVYKDTGGILNSPLKTDDFFPYGTDEYSYWTGYFTSRPTLKRFERIGNNFLQVCKQLSATTNAFFDITENLNNLREAMGMMQHHDAVTGTEKEAVAFDYSKILHSAIADCEEVTRQALSELTQEGTDSFHTCLLTNVSQCVHSENMDRLVVTVYNPLSKLVTKYVRFPVADGLFVVKDPSGIEITPQLIPIAKHVRNIPGRDSIALQELVFAASDIPPLGFKSFFIEKFEGGDKVLPAQVSACYSNSKHVGVEIDIETGLISGISANGITLELNQTFFYYNGANGFHGNSWRPSGAYVFRPAYENSTSNITDRVNYTVYTGPVVMEIQQEFNDWIGQTIRIYENENFVEFDWVVGPISLEFEGGKEVVTKFSTNLVTSSTFYTDSNGRELMKRIKDFRPTWNLATNETISSNYFPVTSHIVVRDVEKNIEMGILTDRAQGGTSLRDGELELMVHRNAITDDGFGVDEALIELAFGEGLVARGSHYIVVAPITGANDNVHTAATLERELAEQKLLDSWVFLTRPEELTFEEYQRQHSMQFQGLTTTLPRNVHILTLEPWRDDSFLLRLEHIFAKEEHPILSQPAVIDIKDLFSTFTITSIRETTLGANQWLEDNQRLKFQSFLNPNDGESLNIDVSDFIITLNPMEIRTFVVNIINRHF
ncbi:lysosomal alpha-mannosidase-like [Cylas formicarius]|uniref:lysosomal alpha-mannosidase-like n=1 Tax=Cylas formicarius TaxID=197179 RepID=UPI00295835CD|nr:lysosomal alpha-mannosidase-like [Cylas formicarius]